MLPGTESTSVPGSAAQSSAQATTQSSAAAPEGFVEKARLDGALTRIQELTLANRSLTDQLTAANQKIGSLESDGAQKAATWQAQQSEFETKLQGAEQEKSQLNSRLSGFEATQLKLKVIKELKRPELVDILDVIPDIADEAQLREKIVSLANFASTLTQKREQELLAGETHVENNANTKAANLPSSNEGWQSYVNSLPLGSPERQEAMNAWHAQLFKQQ